MAMGVKERFTLVSIVLVLAVSLPVIAGGTKETQKAAGSSTQSVTTLHVMAIAQPYALGLDMAKQELLQRLGVEFKYDMSPPQDAYSKLMLQFASNTSSSDIALFQPANLADFVPYLSPIESLAKEYDVNLYLNDMMSVYRDYATWNGVLYAMPWDGDKFMLFYNKKAFNDPANKAAFKQQFGYDLAPPQTWTQYVQMASFFNGRDWSHTGKKGYGVAEAWQRGGYAYWWWWAKFIAMGGVPFDENMNPLINSEAGKKALEVMVKISKFVPPGSANFGYPESQNAFIKGDVPMAYNWSSVGTAAEDPKESSIVGNVGAAVLPGVDVNGTVMHRFVLPTGWVMGIPKFSKQQELAIKSIGILSEPKMSQKIAMNPATVVDAWRTSDFADSIWNSLWPDNPGYGEQYNKVQLETVEKGVKDLAIPGSNDYLQALDKQISAAIVGDVSVDQALNNAAAEWNQITDRRGRDNQKKAWLIEYDSMKARGVQYQPSWANSVRLP